MSHQSKLVLATILDVLLFISPALLEELIKGLTSLGNFLIMALALGTTIYRFVAERKRRKAASKQLQATEKEVQHA